MNTRVTLALAVGAIAGLTVAVFAVLRARAAGQIRREQERTIDQAGEMSFPASDPPSWTGTHASG